jgi:triacylglycerol lipase
LVSAVALVVACAVGATAAHAGAEPELRTPNAQLRAATDCFGNLRKTDKEPILLVHGTGGSGEDLWSRGVNFVAVLGQAGFVPCTVQLPNYALGDVQVSAEYVVAATRVIARKADRPIALYGHSQGGLLVRWALTYWPSLRASVADAVTVAATHHGTDGGIGKPFVDANCQPTVGCPPALWQQTLDSKLLDALNAGRRETPGKLAWTTIRTTTDDLVQPHPTSALKGATNVVIQNHCPGRDVTHFEAPYDSVSYAALKDAVTHRGPSKPARFAQDVCAREFAPGIDPDAGEAATSSGLTNLLERSLAYTPQAISEPAVRAYARR